jgi:myo-inositol 2-dehydrogenase/D-chiro-inositol 1-dehydrogenase
MSTPTAQKGFCHIGEGRIFDPKGKLIWEFDRGSKDQRARLHDGHQQEHHDLFRVLRAGEIPNEGDYGAYSSMTSVLGRMATYSGKNIKWADALASNKVISPVEKFTSFSDTPPVLPNEDMTYAIPMPGKTEVL